MKLLINNINGNHSFAGFDMYQGESKITGALINVTVVNCKKPHMFYCGQNEELISEGKTFDLFFKNVGAEEALWIVQQKVETDQPLVKKVVVSSWIAIDQYGRKIECDSEETAVATHARFGEPSRTDVVTFI